MVIFHSYVKLPEGKSITISEMEWKDVLLVYTFWVAMCKKSTVTYGFGSKIGTS